MIGSWFIQLERKKSPLHVESDEHVPVEPYNRPRPHPRQMWTGKLNIWAKKKYSPFRNVIQLSNHTSNSQSFD